MFCKWNVECFLGGGGRWRPSTGTGPPALISQGLPLPQDVPCSTSNTVDSNKFFPTLTGSSQALGLIPTHQAKQPSHLPFKGIPELWNEFYFYIAKQHGSESGRHFILPQNGG